MKGGERRLVEALVAALGDPGEGAEVGPGDDAAVVRVDDVRLVLTVDTQREEVHFRRRWLAPGQLGWRSVAVAVSDIGAMGARPRWALCAAAVPSSTDREWLEALFGGMGQAGRDLGCPIAGGDVSTGERVELVVTVIGSLAEGRSPLLRSGARAGHGCWLFGELGHAAAGRALLAAERRIADDAMLLEAYRTPHPPLALGATLGEGDLVSAMMDVSDGLGIDLARMCRASGVGVEVDGRSLDDPRLERAAQDLGADALGWQVAGGDDYCLLAAVPPADEAAVRRSAADLGVRGRRIGTFTAAREELVLLDHAGRRRPLEGGWDPFAEGEGS